MKSSKNMAKYDYCPLSRYYKIIVSVIYIGRNLFNQAKTDTECLQKVLRECLDLSLMNRGRVVTLHYVCQFSLWHEGVWGNKGKTPYILDNIWR